MPPTDACILRWHNYKCAIDHWSGECREFIPIKLQCQNVRRALQAYNIKKGGSGGCEARIEGIVQLKKNAPPKKLKKIIIRGVRGCKPLKVLYN